jgi:hypothetical protein
MQSKEASALNIKRGLFMLIIVGSLLLGDLGNFDATGGFSAAGSAAADMQSMNASITDQAPINSSDTYSDTTGGNLSDDSGSDGNDSHH